MANKKVFLLGVFDMFHYGHLQLLQAASHLGVLTVGIVTDFPIKHQKGMNRPIINEVQRRAIIAGLKGVSETVMIPEFKIPQEIIDEYDIIVIGADQSHIKNLDDIPNIKRWDIPRTEGISTSDIIKKIKES